MANNLPQGFQGSRYADRDLGGLISSSRLGIRSPLSRSTNGVLGPCTSCISAGRGRSSQKGQRGFGIRGRSVMLTGALAGRVWPVDRPSPSPHLSYCEVGNCGILLFRHSGSPFQIALLRVAASIGVFARPDQSLTCLSRRSADFQSAGGLPAPPAVSYPSSIFLFLPALGMIELAVKILIHHTYIICGECLVLAASCPCLEGTCTRLTRVVTCPMCARKAR
jgi:hypothetical protein